MFILNIIRPQPERFLEESPGILRIRGQNQARSNINNALQELIIMLNSGRQFSQEQIDNQINRTIPMIERHLGNLTNSGNGQRESLLMTRTLFVLSRRDTRGLIQAWRDMRQLPSFPSEQQVNPEGITGVRPISTEIARILRPMHIMLNNRGVHFTQQEIDAELNRIRPTIEALFGNMARIDERRKEAADLLSEVLFNSISGRNATNFNGVWNALRNAP